MLCCGENLPPFLHGGFSLPPPCLQVKPIERKLEKCRVQELSPKRCVCSCVCMRVCDNVLYILHSNRKRKSEDVTGETVDKKIKLEARILLPLHHYDVINNYIITRHDDSSNIACFSSKDPSELPLPGISRLIS